MLFCNKGTASAGPPNTFKMSRALAPANLLKLNSATQRAKTRAS
jgi:hypothetical protein